MTPYLIDQHHVATNDRTGAGHRCSNSIEEIETKLEETHLSRPTDTLRHAQSDGPQCMAHKAGHPPAPSGLQRRFSFEVSEQGLRRNMYFSWLNDHIPERTNPFGFSSTAGTGAQTPPHHKFNPFLRRSSTNYYELAMKRSKEALKRPDSPKVPLLDVLESD